MNDLEMTKKLFLLLGAEEQKNVARQAIQEGVTIPGFSKKAYMAPPKTICSCMGKKVKNGKYYYEIILEVLARYAEQDENFVYTAARNWIRNEEMHSLIEEDLKKLLQNNEKCVENVEEDKIEIEQNVEMLSKRMVELEDEVTTVRAKNKKYKSTIYENKVEIDNLRKFSEKTEKENKNLKIEIEELKSTIKEYEKSKNSLEKEINEYKKYIDNLLRQIDILEQYKDNAPKILCFAAGREAVKIPGYDIDQMREWNEKVRQEIDINNYMEIWFVHKGFSYNTINEIKENYNCKITEYMTIEKLVESVGGK